MTVKYNEELYIDVIIIIIIKAIKFKTCKITFHKDIGPDYKIIDFS